MWRKKLQRMASIIHQPISITNDQITIIESLIGWFALYKTNVLMATSIIHLSTIGQSQFEHSSQRFFRKQCIIN